MTLRGVMEKYFVDFLEMVDNPVALALRLRSLTKWDREEIECNYKFFSPSSARQKLYSTICAKVYWHELKDALKKENLRNLEELLEEEYYRQNPSDQPKPSRDSLKSSSSDNTPVRQEQSNEVSSSHDASPNLSTNSSPAVNAVVNLNFNGGRCNSGELPLNINISVQNGASNNIINYDHAAKDQSNTDNADSTDNVDGNTDCEVIIETDASNPSPGSPSQADEVIYSRPLQNEIQVNSAYQPRQVSATQETHRLQVQRENPTIIAQMNSSCTLAEAGNLSSSSDMVFPPLEKPTSSGNYGTANQLTQETITNSSSQMKGFQESARPVNEGLRRKELLQLFGITPQTQTNHASQEEEDDDDEETHVKILAE